MPQSPKQHRKNLIYGAAWRKARKLALERDGHRCVAREPGCKVAASTVDHVVPVDRGGAWYELANLQSLCSHCHYSVKQKRDRGSSAAAPSSRFPARTFRSPCPHRALDGSGDWCVGDPRHWSRWWIGSPEEA
jgi:5-methylcytosine-specific restriction protein A